MVGENLPVVGDPRVVARVGAQDTRGIRNSTVEGEESTAAVDKLAQRLAIVAADDARKSEIDGKVRGTEGSEMITQSESSTPGNEEATISVRSTAGGDTGLK
jgi:hypothetical protein